MPTPLHSNDEYAIREEPAGHRAAAQALQPDEDQAQHSDREWQPRRAAMKWNLFVSGYGFPWTPGAMARWLLLSAWAIVAVSLARLSWLMLSGASSPAAGGAMSSFGIVIGSVLTGLGGIVFGAVFAALASIHGLTILTETAAGNDRIESWPNIGLFLEWFCNLFYVINAAALSAALACALGALVPPARGAVIGVVEFLVFPFLLMSELEANSAFMPVSQLVFASLWRQARPWTSFYVQSGCLLVAAVALPVLASPHIDSRLGVVFGGLIVAAVAMIYFRLLGRLAWHCSIEKEDDAAPEQEITEESTVEEGTFEQRPVKP